MKLSKQSIATKIKEKIEMYDMIIANLIAGNAIIEPSKTLEKNEIAIGFSNIASESQISKYFIIKSLPDYVRPNLMGAIREKCLNNGVKINFYVYSKPHKINWQSAEMQNKLAIWRKYARENPGNSSVFDYRSIRDSQLAKRRIIQSTKFLNEAELDYKRSLCNVAFIIEVTAKRDEDSILNLSDSIDDLKEICSQYDIRLRELRVNMIDWLQTLSPFSLLNKKEITSKISRRVMTDDILANFNSYRQGRVGNTGLPIAIDVSNGSPILYMPKEDPSAAENWLIVGETQSGKSALVKNILFYLLANNIRVCVMDYEGDEYTNIARYIKASNADDAKIISMGKGSTVYFDPMEIAFTTGVDEIDEELKENALNSTMAIFRTIVCGISDKLDTIQEKILSTAIKRVYESAGVTDAKETWKRSIGLRLSMVYEEIKEMVESKELVDYDTGNINHKSAIGIVDACSIYFEIGETKATTFKNPISVNELLKSKLIVFSFGMRGAVGSEIDPIVLALKQISVANVNIQISNYCKYVLGLFNAKLWEEFQRWAELEGSGEIISNAITGGRKRGDINFIITNDAAALLNKDNKLNRQICMNIQHKAIGKINDKFVRDGICEMFDLQEVSYSLDIIAKSNVKKTISNGDKMAKSVSSGYGSKYKNAFCFIFDNGNKTIGKAAIPPSLAKSALFMAGVNKLERRD